MAINESPSTSSGAASSGTARRPGEELADKVTDALQWGRSGISESASAAGESLTEDMKKLRDDIASIQETLKTFVSEAGGEASKTARKIGTAVGSQIGTAAASIADAGKDAAAATTERVKTVASELETFARNQPLGALAGALLVGVVIGLMGRSRS